MSPNFSHDSFVIRGFIAYGCGLTNEEYAQSLASQRDSPITAQGATLGRQGARNPHPPVLSPESCKDGAMSFDRKFPKGATLWLSVILGAVTRAAKTLALLAFARPGLC